MIFGTTMSMPVDSPLGETWGFAQMSNAGKGYWYKIGLGRSDEAGRALGKVNTSPFKTFTGDIIICLHGTKPPGAAADRLVKQRLLLPQDADLIISQAGAAAVP